MLHVYVNKPEIKVYVASVRCNLQTSFDVILGWNFGMTALEKFKLGKNYEAHRAP